MKTPNVVSKCATRVAGLEAETVYRRDLEKHPRNGWALFGLWKSLEPQHKPEARQARSDFGSAWSRADTKLTRSAF